MAGLPSNPAPGFTTGNPGLDSLIRSGLLLASGGLTVMILTWLNAKGFATTDIVIAGTKISPSVLIGGAVFTFLSAASVVFWGWFKGTQVGKLVTNAQIEGVTAGIALTATGNAQATVTHAGEIVPKPVTATTAKIIIENFGPQQGAPVLGQATPAGADQQAVTAKLNVQSAQGTLRP